MNIKILLAICAANKWTTKTSDVKSTFLQMRKIKSQSSLLLKRDLGKVTDWSIEVSTDASSKNLNDGVHSTAAGVIQLKNNNNIAVPVM